MIYTTTYESPIGKLFLAAGNEALIGLWIQGQKYFPEKLFSGQDGVMDCTGKKCGILAQTGVWMDQYFAGDRPNPGRLKLAPGLARRRGLNSMSAQAVGGGVGHNPISIIIPCHRVVGADGSLTGYAGGVEKKRWLLKLEGALEE